MIDLAVEGLRACFGLGVAGNFAGHLEQAGEAGDFASVDAAAAAPKGVFPFYVPGDDGFLGVFPLSSDRLELPPSESPLNLQIEPEAGVLCDVAYEDGRPSRLAPIALAAFNDCSIRREGAVKISEKKNWGPASKGVAARAFAIDELERDGASATLRLACFLRRGGECFEYGVDSPLAGYSYYGDQLLDWIVERLLHQSGGDTPLEPVGEYLAACGSPGQLLIGIGATRYSDFGSTNYLEPGDESIVTVYDAAANPPEAVRRSVGAGTEAALTGASVLVQTVELSRS